VTKAYLLRRPKLGMSSGKGIQAHSKTGIISRRYAHNIPDDVDMVFRWGCTADVPTRNIINTAKAIHQVADKAVFRKTLNDGELCPPTFFDGGPPVRRYPVVARPHVHARGKHTYLCHDQQELNAAIRKCGDGWYASTFIDKVAEYRIFIVQGRCVCVAQKTPANPDDVAWNVAKGGRFDNVRWDDWPLVGVRVGIEAFNLSSLDFGGVDVMIDGDGDATVLEINSAPSLTSPYRQECMAKAFDWIVDHGKERIPLIKERGGYLKFIHPAINGRAKVEV